MNKKIQTEAVDHLFEAILSLENKEECYGFFEDLCTVNELLSLPALRGGIHVKGSQDLP